MKKQKELIIINKIYITSDLHFCHDRAFIWEARGYKNVEEMNREQVQKWNSVVTKQDEVWLLGDLIMNDNVQGAKYLSQLNGIIHVITGNHCSPARIEIYKQLGFDVQDGKRLSYKKKNFLLSHEPMITSNGNFKGWRDTVNVHGHTHQTQNFTDKYPLMYHAGVDSHNGYPVLLDDIIEEMSKHWRELNLV